MNNSLQSFIPQNQNMNFQNQNFNSQNPKKVNSKLAKVILGFFYIGIIIIAVGCFYFFTRKTSDFYIVDKSMVLTPGETYKLKVHVKQELDINNEDSYLVSWMSDNPLVAEIDSNGNVTTKALGMATIKAILYDGSESSIVISVSDTKEEKLEFSFSASKYELEIGDSKQLEILVNPEGVDYGKVTWSSSNKDIVSVDSNGLITAKKAGSTKITAKFMNGNKISCDIKVNKINKKEYVKILEPNKAIKIGDEVKLDLDITKNNKKEELTWVSSNPSVVSVDDNGKLVAKDNGTATITVISDSGEVSTSEVTVSDKVVSVTGINLLDKEVSIFVGDKKTLNVDIKPIDATDKTVVWTSSNSNVSVDENGTITGLKAGKATITAISSNGIKSKCSVEVKGRDVAIESISIDNSNVILEPGEDVELMLNVMPLYATNKSITWTSNNNNVAIVNNGRVTAKSVGKATITAKSNNGKIATAMVEVKESAVAVKSIKLSQTSASLYTGDSLTLTASISPSNATYKDIVWSSSNSDIVSIDSNGYLIANKKGSVVITATSSNGKKATCKIEVKNKTIPVDSLTIGNSNITLEPGASVDLILNISPSNATNKKITWTTSNSKIATVSDGKVTAKKVGTVTITAKSNNGKTATAVVQVKESVVAVKSIKLSQTSASLYTGDSLTLTASISPSNATYKNIIWSSSDTSIATVDSNGKVIAKKKGSVVITAASSNGKKVTCKIEVKNKTVEVTGITLSKNNLSLYTGEEFTLTTSISPSNATNKTVTWTSSNNNIATVTNGKITAKAVGTAIITVKTNNGKTATATVSVKEKVIAVTNLKLSKSTTSLYVGDKLILTATVTPGNATYKTVTWTSSNSDIVTVDSKGNVIAKKKGTATITAISNNGKKASCKIEVKNKAIAVTNITLNKTSSNLYVGDSLTLTASISPSDATNKTVTWTSSNSNVATVSNGKVTAKKTGTVVITASSSNGKTARATINVIERTVNVTAISLNKSDISLYPNASIDVIATVSPSNATNKIVTWTSSNSNVATVSNGKITAKNNGTATITATSSNGKQAKIKVTVLSRSVVATGISINKSSINVLPGNTYLLEATVSPSDATNKTVTWTSSNNNIATVGSNGVVTGKSVGQVTITAKTDNGKTATCIVNVVSNSVDATGISLNQTFASLEIGQSVNLSATVSPSNATNKLVTWTSNNNGVATVSNGKVTAVNGGTAVITATTNNGKKVSATITVRYKRSTEAEMRSSYGRLVSSQGTGSYYAYAPSILVKNNQWYIYSCQNKDAGKTYDHIYLNTSGLSLILAPGSGWDSYHVCDPSVVEGDFVYNGVHYKYAMAYLGINTPNGMGNNIGIALSNNLSSGWIRVGNGPYISSNVTNRWGVGQPSLIYVNNKLIMFYTNDTGVGTGMQVRIINPNNMQIEASGNLSTKNTTWMHNADFAYKDNRLYVAYEGNESTSTGDIISDTIQIRSAYISNYTNINEYANLNWEYENAISSKVSGQARNTNAGLFRDQYGGLFSRQVGFTATDNGSGNGHFSYHIYKSSF